MLNISGIENGYVIDHIKEMCIRDRCGIPPFDADSCFK